MPVRGHNPRVGQTSNQAIVVGRDGAGLPTQRTDPRQDTLEEGSGASRVTTSQKKPAPPCQASPRPATTDTYRRFSSASQETIPTEKIAIGK